jgi:hypothetical protein
MEELLHPIQPLADKFDALEATVLEQGEQQALNLALVSVEQALQGGGANPRRTGRVRRQVFLRSPVSLSCRRQRQLHRRRAANVPQAGFPKYDGSRDPRPWLNRCGQFFRVRRTLVHKHVLAGAQGRVRSPVRDRGGLRRVRDGVTTYHRRPGHLHLRTDGHPTSLRQGNAGVRRRQRHNPHGAAEHGLDAQLHRSGRRHVTARANVELQSHARRPLGHGGE